jgi:hypothetical protein
VVLDGQRDPLDEDHEIEGAGLVAEGLHGPQAGGLVLEPCVLGPALLAPLGAHLVAERGLGVGELRQVGECVDQQGADCDQQGAHQAKPRLGVDRV